MGIEPTTPCLQIGIGVHERPLMSRDRGYSGDLTAGVRRCPEGFGPPLAPHRSRGLAVTFWSAVSRAGPSMGGIASNQLAVTGLARWVRTHTT